MSTTRELRDYVIAEGHLDDFVTAWRAGVVPLRELHGFRVDGAWMIPLERRFVWIVSLDADEAEFSRRNEAYYADPARATLDPDPARWIEAETKTFVEPALW
jgi:hypothetical protein